MDQPIIPFQFRNRKRCIYCASWKRRCAFRLSGKSKDGLSAICISCSNGYIRRKKRRRSLILRICKRCGIARPLHMYTLDNSRQDKLKTWCCECCRVYIRNRRRKNPNFYRKSSRASKKRIRLLALTHYGGDPPQCACCGESAYEFLALDHKKGGGEKHRKKTSYRGFEMAVWLRRAGWPKGFRVLCHNCNMAIGFYGRCPHQGKKYVTHTPPTQNSKRSSARQPRQSRRRRRGSCRPRRGSSRP